MDSITSSIDVEDFILTKDNKEEIENKVARILKLIKNNDGQDNKGKVLEDSKNKSELVELIKDLHKQYQALNVHYDHLKGEMEKKFWGIKEKKEKNKSSSSSSSSESDDEEYYSSEEIENVKQRASSGKNSKNFPDDALKHILLAKPHQEFNQGFLGKSPRSARKRDAHMKELEGQVNILRMELESERESKNILESKIKDKENEVMNLKLESEKKGEEIFVMTEKMEESERKFKNLEMEKAEVLEKFKNLEMEKAEVLEKFRNLEMEKVEVSEKFKNLEMEKAEVSKKFKNLEMEKAEVSEKFRNLEMEKAEVSEKFKNLEMEKAEESEKVKFLKQELEIKTLKLSKIENLKDELVKEKENSGMQMEELKLEVESLQEENKKLESRTAEKMVVETEIPNLSEEVQQKSIQECKLTRHQSMDFAGIHKVDSTKSLTQQKAPIVSSKVKQNHLERKIDELAEKFEMKMENHIKLLSRRIRIAEQIHVETIEKLYQENKEINEKKANFEAEVKKMREMLLNQGNNILLGMEIMVSKFNEQNREFMMRISRIIKEVDSANYWVVRKGDEMKKLKCCLENLEKEKIMLTEKVEKIEEELNNVRLNGENRIEELEQKLKEKDEILIIIGDEKREAIRQLCVLIDYHRNRYDLLKDAVSKMSVKFKKSV